MCIKIYKKIYIDKHENIQKYRNTCRKIFIGKYKRVYKQQKI